MQHLADIAVELCLQVHVCNLYFKHREIKNLSSEAEISNEHI